MVELNKKVYICFLAAFFMTAASPIRAAEASSAAAPPRQVQVVKADPRTGKLVRTWVAAPKPQPVKPSADVNALVEKSAKAHSIDPLLIHSVIQVESNYNARAVSNKGAQGLMQLTPPTARMLGVSDSFDPQQNIEAGVRYLKHLKDLYKDDRLALAAYNAGPGAVDKYKQQVPPYKETRDYVEQVGKRYDQARRAAGAAQPPAPTQPEQLKPVEPAKPAAVETRLDENGRPQLRTIQ
jgi:soluble lytic murein transglycosylase-like protein